MDSVAPDVFRLALPRGGTETIMFGLAPGRTRVDDLQMSAWALARIPDFEVTWRG